MHRSGTSLTASWLERCGVAIHDGSLIAPAAGNRHGHFEDREIVLLHAAVLEGQAAGSSVGWSVAPDTALRFGPAERKAAEALVRCRSDKFAIWGWKDPRTVLFLDEWKTLVPELKVVLLWRPPAEVVDSLLRRSRRAINPDLKARTVAAGRLWKAYNQRVVDYRLKHMSSTVLLPMETVRQDDRWVLDLVRERFQMDLIYSPIADLYAPDLGKGRRDPFSRRLSSLATRGRSFAKIERQLRQASDSPPPALAGP